MILDQQNKFSDGQAITATTLSSNVIDRFPFKAQTNPATVLGNASGTAISLFVVATEAFAAGGAATMTVSLESGDNPDLTGNTVVHFTSGPLPLASLGLGARAIFTALPASLGRRYLGLRYTVGTGPMTAGKVVAGLVLGAADNSTYYAQSVTY